MAGAGAGARLGVGLLLGSWAAWVGGCAHAPTPGAPAPGGIQARHFDQACRAVGRAPTEVRLAELFDTAGLVTAVGRVGVRPLPLTPPWPVYGFVVRYGADGRPMARGTWDATVEPDVAALLEGELRGRVRSLPPLLEATAYRAQVVFARRVRVELAAPVECMPHMAHPPGGRPYGLDPELTTWGAASYRGEGGDRTAVVRIRVGRDGSVLGVDSLEGGGEMMARARAQVMLLRFEPALVNGAPVEGELIQGFYLRVAEPG